MNVPGQTGHQSCAWRALNVAGATSLPTLTTLGRRDLWRCDPHHINALFRNASFGYASFLIHTALLASRSRRASMLMISRANEGARLTRATKSFFETGTNAESVLATAVALRGAEADRAISPKMSLASRVASRRLPSRISTCPLLMT